MSEPYQGPVCYADDGFHHAVDVDADGNETVGARLVLDDDGSYRAAAEGDRSWHERTHRGYSLIVPEDGTPGIAVTEDEMKAIQQMLDERRGG